MGIGVESSPIRNEVNMIMDKAGSDWRRLRRKVYRGLVMDIDENKYSKRSIIGVEV